ncbi:hypothetical protein D3C73_1535710 [compost metagenome]
MVGPEAAFPLFLTTAFSVTALPSAGEAGDQVMPVTVKSGFGAGEPKTWNSAICPEGAPELEVMFNCSRLTVADTGRVTEFPEDGLKV